MAVVEEETEESVGIPDYAGVNLTLESRKFRSQVLSERCVLERGLIWCQPLHLRTKNYIVIQNTSGKKKKQKWKKLLHFLSSKTRVNFPTFFFSSTLNYHILTFVLQQRLWPNTTDKLLSLDMWMPRLSAAHPSSFAAIDRSDKHTSPRQARI